MDAPRGLVDITDRHGCVHACMRTLFEVRPLGEDGGKELCLLVDFDGGPAMVCDVWRLHVDDLVLRRLWADLFSSPAEDDCRAEAVVLN